MQLKSRIRIVVARYSIRPKVVALAVMLAIAIMGTCPGLAASLPQASVSYALLQDMNGMSNMAKMPACHHAPAPRNDRPSTQSCCAQHHLAADVTNAHTPLAALKASTLDVAALLQSYSAATSASMVIEAPPPLPPLLVSLRI